MDIFFKFYKRRNVRILNKIYDSSSSKIKNKSFKEKIILKILFKTILNKKIYENSLKVSI